MEGGSIFNFTFKLPILSFLYGILITIIIAIFLAIVFGLLFAGNYMVGANTYVFAFLGFAYTVMAMYAPFDYIYTMGLEASKA